MNIVFYILVIIGLFILYLILSWFFELIGKIVIKIWRRLKRNIGGEENEKG